MSSEAGVHVEAGTTAAYATVRLTTAQALVRYLQVQYSEHDGIRRRVIPALFAIYGHGNVCGLGQAVEKVGRDLLQYEMKYESRDDRRS